MKLMAVCSNKPRPSVGTRKNGGKWWARDVYHIQQSGMTTLCGVDCSEWLRIGELDALTVDCCERCAKKVAA